jgi:hypothetical protein
MLVNLYILSQFRRIRQPNNIGEYTFLEFTKQIDLPYPPFIGLTIQLTPTNDEDAFDVTRIEWDHSTQKFNLFTDDIEHPDIVGHNHTAANIIEYYTKLGWTICEDNNGSNFRAIK